MASLRPVFEVGNDNRPKECGENKSHKVVKRYYRDYAMSYFVKCSCGAEWIDNLKIIG